MWQVLTIERAPFTEFQLSSSHKQNRQKIFLIKGQLCIYYISTCSSTIFSVLLAMLMLLLLILSLVPVKISELKKKGRERKLPCKVTWCNISRPQQNVFNLLSRREQLKDATTILERYHHTISPQPFMSFKQTSISSLFSNEPSDLCQVKSSMGQGMNQNLSSWLFPLRSMN